MRYTVAELFLRQMSQWPS